jgi:tetratricopeptide (TPR) repeat protein
MQLTVMIGRSALRAVYGPCVAAAVLAPPAPARAQQAVFVKALTELTAALEGTFGDEGARVQPALDTLDAALAAWDRQIAAADASFRAALANAPPSTLVDRRVTRGRMFADRGRIADALAELDAAVSLDPQRAEAHVLRGLVLRESGRTSEAIAAFRTARATAPDDPVAAYYLFRELAVSGDAQDAREAAGAIAAAYQRLRPAQQQTNGGPFQRIALLSTDGAGPPLVPLGLYRQAFGRIAMGEYEQAIGEFRRAAAIDPLVSDSAAGFGSIGRAIGALRQVRLSEARSLVEQSAADADSSEAHRVRGLVYWADSNYEKAIAELNTAIAQAPRNERARLALSRVFSSMGRDADAELALQETLRALPESALARWWLASAYERVNRFTEARQELEHAAAAAIHGESQLHGAVARLASGAADFPAAIAALQRAVNAQPNDPAMHRLLARALVQQDRADEAVAEFVAALLIDPRDAEALAGIGQIHLNAGRHTEAAEVLGRATEMSPGNSEVRYALASALVRLGRTEEAAQHFAEIEQAQRQLLADRRRTLSSDVLKEEAALRVAEGQLEAAVTLYEKALAVAADPALYGQLAELYAKVGRALDAARALAMYEQARLRGRATGSTAR